MIKKDKLSAYSAIIVILITLILLTIGINYINFVINTQIEETKKYLSEVTIQNSKSITNQINGDIKFLNGLSVFISEINEIEHEKFFKILREENEKNSFIRMGYISKDGYGFSVDLEGSYSEDNNLLEKEYFKAAIRGQNYISNSINDIHNNEYVNIYSVPVYKNSEIIGILCALHKTDTFQKTLNVPFFDGEGYSFITDGDGNIVINSPHKNSDKNINNIFDNISNNEFSLEKIKVDMKNARAGITKYISSDNNKKWLSYYPLGINDWYIISIIPVSIISKKTNTLISITVVITMIAAFITFILMMYIMSIKIENKKTISKLAYTDELTGCKNKNKFNIDAPKIIKYKTNNYAIATIDVNNFKTINDLFGFSEGDLILKYMANVIDNNLNKGEIYARAVADKFYILMKYDSENEIKLRINNIMNQISKYESKTNTKSKYNIVCYAGIYKITESDINKDINVLIDRSGLALMTLKNKHTNCHAFYNDKIRNKIIFESELENDMYKALANNEFIIYIQPKYDLKTEKLAGAEALIRWQHNEKGFLPPDEFVPLFEKNGFITEIDMFVLKTICQKQKEWLSKGIKTVPISINQSRLHLYKPDYVKILKDIITNYDVPASLIELEITESVAFESMNIMSDIIEKFHKIGFTVSMDDFGSGYSSLNMLKNLDVDILKIDKKFFEESSDTEKGKKIISSIISMANTLHIKTVSEGVETIEQVKFLQKVGCTLAQGYYYAKPMPINEYEKNELHY